MTCKALCPFQLKCVVVIVKVIRLNTNEKNKFIVLIVHEYEESNVDFKFFLNCCKLGNCVMSLARPFHMCVPLTVIDRSFCAVCNKYEKSK